MMGSGINNGSIVLVRKQEYVENGDVAVVMVDEESATIKRVYYHFCRKTPGFIRGEYVKSNC